MKLDPTIIYESGALTIHLRVTDITIPTRGVFGGVVLATEDGYKYEIAVQINGKKYHHHTFFVGLNELKK